MYALGIRSPNEWAVIIQRGELSLSAANLARFTPCTVHPARVAHFENVGLSSTQRGLGELNRYRIFPYIYLWRTAGRSWHIIYGEYYDTAFFYSSLKRPRRGGEARPVPSFLQISPPMFRTTNN